MTPVQENGLAPVRRSDDIVVIMGRRDFTCAGCREEFGRGRWFRTDDAGTLCLSCADLGHLAFLPRGHTALTRRAKKHGWSRDGARRQVGKPSTMCARAGRVAEFGSALATRV